MTANNEHVERQIEISIEAARAAVERKEILQALFQVKEFKLIFEEGYFKEEPARLVSLLNDPEWAGDEKQEELLRDMYGISALRQYLMGQHQMGVQMERSIAASEAELESLRSEEVGV